MNNFEFVRLEIFTEMKIQVVFWVSGVVRYQHFGGSCCLRVQGIMALQNIGILPHHYSLL